MCVQAGMLSFLFFLFLLVLYKETASEQGQGSCKAWLPVDTGHNSHTDTGSTGISRRKDLFTPLSSNTAAAIHREETPGRRLGGTHQQSPAHRENPPQYLGSVQNHHRFTKGVRFTVRYPRGARRRGKMRDTGPCWYLVYENAP